MKISIVTISYNQGQFLEETINSVLNQRGAEWEYVVIDPGSKDQSRDIINFYKNKIDRIIFDPDNGPGDGLNKGFDLCSGEIFGYLNSDDILLPGTLKFVNEYFERHPECDVLSGHGYVYNEHSEIVHKIFSNKLSQTYISKIRFSIGCSVIVQQATFFRRDLFKKVNGFDNSYKVMWDAAITADFINHNAVFHVVNRPLAAFRVYSHSITGSGTQFSERGKNEFKKVQAKLNIKKPSFLKRKIVQIGGWLLEPKLLLYRIIDGIAHPKRLV